MMYPIRFKCSAACCTNAGVFHYSDANQADELRRRHGGGRYRCEDHPRRCETCSAFSQLLAEVRGSTIHAACLNPASAKFAESGNPDRWPSKRSSCAFWTDDPSLSDLA
jgi:hypothetical protein